VAPRPSLPRRATGTTGAAACGAPRRSPPGVTGDLRPYRLRGSFVSLLLWSGEDLVYVADQAGHSVATLAKHYAGVIRELRDVEKKPAADLIREAREAIASERGTHIGSKQVAGDSGKALNACKLAMDDAGLEPATSALSRRRSPS
jgi:hypothetical protein